MSSDNIPICPICSGPRAVAFRATVLNKHTVAYLHCQGCGLLQTESPYWLDEAYADPITDADTGLVRRNLDAAATLSAVLYFLVGSRGMFLDTAGGYGLLVRLMRDIGFDFYWADPYAENRFARGFEYSPSMGPVTAITAIEVLEHTPDPLVFLRAQLEEAGADTIVATTAVFSGRPPGLDWSYYTFATGQHISFFQKRTLAYMAERLGLHFHSNGYWHLFTRSRIHPAGFRIAASRLSAALLPWVRRRLKSKRLSDQASILASATPPSETP